jgi:hypothetical protein
MEMPVTKPKLKQSPLLRDVWGSNDTKMDELFLVPNKGMMYFFGTYQMAERFADRCHSIVAVVKWVSPQTPRGLVCAMASANARATHADYVMSGLGGIA